jgi:twitching motility protein PilT
MGNAPAAAPPGHAGPTLAPPAPGSSPAAPPSAPVPGAGAPTGVDFKTILQQMVQRGASDLHLKVGRPATLRVNGDLVPSTCRPCGPRT